MSSARAWQTPALLRYVAFEKALPSDQPCPDRPTPDHVWVNGTGWQVPADLVDRKATSFVDSVTKEARLWFEVTFDHENRVRTLEGKPTVTRAQYRNALINFVKTL